MKTKKFDEKVKLYPVYFTPSFWKLLVRTAEDISKETQKYISTSDIVRTATEEYVKKLRPN